MTEGIIQQVFNKAKLHNPSLELLLDKYQQELIEKIKETYETKEHHSRMIDNRLILSDLIGDNQD